MDFRQAAQTIFDTAAQNLALALALCGANRQLSDAVEELWYEHSKGPDSAVLPSDTDEEPLGPGAIVAGRFRIVRELGHGGTAAVFHAEDEAGRPVALKVSYPGAEAAAGTCPLRAEYAAASAVQHSNVRRVDELLTVESRNARVTQAPIMQTLVMEYIAGETLAARLARAPLSAAELINIARGLAAGLDAIHAAGQVHGDLKPGNILLRQDSVPVIIDLGNQSTAASPDYMSVEQFQGTPATPACDLFALGAILYEMATGHRPWPKEDLLPAAIRRATQDAPALTCTLPPGYAPATAALLNRTPSRRPPTATTALQFLGHRTETRACRHTGHNRFQKSQL